MLYQVALVKKYGKIKNKVSIMHCISLPAFPILIYFILPLFALFA